MARKPIVCLDGTGNETGANLSNVLELYRADRPRADDRCGQDAHAPEFVP